MFNRMLNKILLLLEARAGERGLTVYMYMYVCSIYKAIDLKFDGIFNGILFRFYQCPMALFL